MAGGQVVYLITMRRVTTAACIAMLIFTAAVWAAGYPWPLSSAKDEMLDIRIVPPSGYHREVAPAGSFTAWLRKLPLKPGRPDVLLYNGRKKSNQAAHFAVVDMDTGDRDLQQCADAVMRLRAEYLFSTNQNVRFRFTSGDESSFQQWSRGFRPLIRGNKVTWQHSAAEDRSYASFRKYLDVVFQYAGTASLSHELQPVDILSMQIGDVFIRGGFPGHAVLVADMAVDADGRKVFLLVQSYMPAQEIHVLKNPDSEAMSPWYPLDFGAELNTPEWTFTSDELKRF